jgi:hypothetical protein
MLRHFIFTCLSAILALGIVACGSSGGGGAAAGSGGGGTTNSYTWSQTAGQPLVTVPALPSATVATTAKMRISCSSKSLITSPVRLLVAVDGINRIDKSVTMTLVIAQNLPTVPNNTYEYIVNENLGTIPAGTGRSISVTIDADNTYTAPGPFNIKVFTLVVAVSPSFAG